MKKNRYVKGKDTYATNNIYGECMVVKKGIELHCCKQIAIYKPILPIV